MNVDTGAFEALSARVEALAAQVAFLEQRGRRTTSSSTWAASRPSANWGCRLRLMSAPQTPTAPGTCMPCGVTGDRRAGTPRRDVGAGGRCAAIAAIVSYSHIYALGREHGGSGVAARLLPLSVDMLILVGELMLLHEADAKGRRFTLGWVLVWSGILATLAANVAYGAQFGVLGALIWGWATYVLHRRGRHGGCRQAGRTRRRTRPGSGPSALNGHAHAAAELFAADIERGPGSRHPRYPVRAARGPGQGQPGTGVPAHAHPYPVSTRPGCTCPGKPHPGRDLPKREDKS